MKAGLLAYLLERHLIAKGDFEGHPFRGNQWTTGGARMPYNEDRTRSVSIGNHPKESYMPLEQGKSPRLTPEAYAAAKEKWAAAQEEPGKATEAGRAALQKLTVDLGPEFFHEYARENPEFYEAQIQKMANAWQHIGGEGPTLIRQAAGKAFGNENAPVWDVKAKAFVPALRGSLHDTEADRAKDDADPDTLSESELNKTNAALERVTMWAGAMRLEYEQTQNDIAEGRTMSIGGSISDASEEWSQSDAYSQWYSDQQEESWSNLGTSDKADYINVFDAKVSGYKDDTVSALDTISSAVAGDGTLENDLRDELNGTAFDIKSETSESGWEEVELDKAKPETYAKLASEMTRVINERNALKDEWEEAQKSLPPRPAYPSGMLESEGYAERKAAYDAAYKTYQDAYSKISDEYSAKVKDLYADAKQQFENVFNDGARGYYVESESGQEKVQERYFEDWYPDEMAEHSAMEDWASENNIGEEEHEITHDFLKENVLYRSIRTSTENYVAGPVESWSVSEAKSQDFGHRTMEEQVDATRVLVFQGATNWESKGGFGLTEGEVIVMPQPPAWMPVDADGDGNVEEDADESDEVFTEDTEEEGKLSRAALVAKRLDTLIRQFRTQLGKGDFVGHPFRGNQWTTGAGGGGETSREMRSKPSSAYPVSNPKGVDTLERYKMPDGKFTPERVALHKEIKAEMLNAATPVENSTVYVMGGGPASGKSSMIKKLDVPENHVLADPDHVKTQLPEYAELTAAKDLMAASHVHEESSIVGKQVAKESIEASKNTVIDGTGDSSYESIEKKVEGYRAAGAMNIKANYATIDIEEGLRRMKARGDNPNSPSFGRYVPETYMREVYKNIEDIVPKAFEADLFDELNLWDNSTREPKLVASKVKGGELVVHDAEAWAKFNAKKRRAE